MNYQRTLAGIPIVSADAKAGRRLHLVRRTVQIVTLIVAVLVPVSGLFRIDPVDGAFVVLDRQIWFADFFLVVGLWLAISSLLVMTYSLVGTAFCGWSCPQNTLAEWANTMTYRLLGKRAEVSLDGKPMRVSSGKDKWLNWTMLGTIFLVVAGVAALVPMFYFYSPEMIWMFVTFQSDPRLAGSLYWIYTMFVLILFLDIAFIRHFWCRFMCVYRVWQHTFKTRETLHVAHDKSRPEECSHCNFCETSCFIGIDPRRTEVYDACINCGECITACSSIRGSRKSGNSLLRFAIGEAGSPVAADFKHTNVGSILLRVPWSLLLTVFGLSLFSWGIWSYQPYHFSVYRAETLQGEQISDYRISLANKLYRPAVLSIQVEGLAPDEYALDSSQVSFVGAGRQDVNLHIDGGLSPGLYPVLVHVDGEDGRRESFRVQHFVATSDLGHG
jgi:polyferredoxin